MERSPAVCWIHTPAAAAVLFAVSLSPLLVDHLLFHPDERHYVDAGLSMVESGDWWTPRTAEGDLRLQKPILSYWVVAAGAWALGPSPFSTRVLFLLCGAAMVWWAGRAGHEASGSRQAGILTALLTACHPALIISATRSLPDVVLGLSMTISLAGFVGILARGRADWAPLLTAYVGGAAAILAKGTPAVVFVVYATLWIAWTNRTVLLGQWKRFAAAIGLCALLGGSWFALMEMRHGSAMANQFMLDQGAPYRFAANPGQVLVQVALTLLLHASSFVLVLAAAARPLWIRRRDVRAIGARPVHLFLLGWVLLFLGCAACINHVSLRYLLPVTAPTAVLLGSLLTELEGPLLRRNLRRLAWVSIAALPVAGLVFVACFGVAAPGGLAAMVAAAVVGWWIKQQMRFTSALRSVSVVATAGLLSIMLLAWTGIGAMGPSFGYRAVAAVRRATDGELPRTPLLLIGEPAHASRIRVCSGGLLKVSHVYLREESTVDASGLVARLETDGVSLRSETGDVRVPCGLENVELSEVWRAILSDRLGEFLDEHRRCYALSGPPGADGQERSATAVAEHDDGTTRR